MVVGYRLFSDGWDTTPSTTLDAVSGFSVIESRTIQEVQWKKYSIDMPNLGVDESLVWVVFFDIRTESTDAAFGQFSPGAFPQAIDISLSSAISMDMYGIYADGVRELSLQYWDETQSTWTTANSQSGESVICTGGIAWFSVGQVINQQRWRLLISDADVDCKIFACKMCNTTTGIENIEISAASVLALNPLAKSASSATTYIKAVDTAEDIAARALSLRSASRKAVTVQVPNQCGLREIYDVVELSGHRLNDGMYRVTGITEDLATGKTTLELFR
jgi:hypothetical protein